ncbi:MAG: FAD-binding protein [Bacteroidales bacterium]|nr:FAD-binding protein [Bacteroidales bacterium]
MIHNIQLRVDPRTAATPTMLRDQVASALGVKADSIDDIIVKKRSIDARQRRVMVNLTVDAYVGEKAPQSPLLRPVVYGDVTDAPQAIVVGAGPAGLFAALRLIELGVRPVILERGKDVDGRRVDMAQIARHDVVDPDSNYCFGEGGAGAFSDGKLYTRSKKRGNVEKILQIFCQHGASTDILVDAHPHIGTDRLPVVIKAMRDTIVRCGGEIHFSSRVTGLLLGRDGDALKVEGVETVGGDTYRGPVILATGHSARDTYRMLVESGVAIEPKGIAIGVRLEHPQQLIDSIQYHNPQGRGKYLPAAEYSMLTRVDDRAVYSFCMCPGGFVIPSASGPRQQAVNGMSPASRGTRWANSGMVVEILPEDVTQYSGPLKIMQLQEEIEEAFYHESGDTQNAPAQRMTDFVAGRPSTSLPATSYAPGIHAARLDQLLPAPIASRLRRGFEEFGRKSRGFLTDKAIVVGCETRTSAPVRLVRDDVTLRSLNVENLFPAGEGAGYAGGIVSAAVDGERVADALYQQVFAPQS